MEERIERLREKIDRLDEQLVRLLNERVRLALEIAEVKSRLNAPVYAPHREREVIERVLKLNRGPIPPQALEAIFREIISAARALEKPLRIAFLGPPGSFGHEASMKQFGRSVEYLPVQTQPDVFREVEIGRADYGVVAIENSISGSVAETLDMFLHTDLKICAEVMIPIHHHLLAKCRFEEIKRIYSHPQALAQCRGWLDKHMKDVPRIPVSSTSEGASMAAKEEGAAAIASRLAAEVYGLNVVREHIEDQSGNTTRFLVIGKHYAKRSGYDKTSFIFSVRDEPGALMRALERFYKHGLNLTKLESRPYPGRRWEYVFFADVEGHIDDEPMRKAAQELKEVCLLVKFLGSYPRAREV